jgi:hypothetical protein
MYWIENTSVTYVASDCNYQRPLLVLRYCIVPLSVCSHIVGEPASQPYYYVIFDVVWNILGEIMSEVY